jgi:antitoxin VapB
MPETRAVKLFKNGSSQAVRLPAEFRFEGEEVYATRDELTGDVVLSKSPGAKEWKDFFAFARTFDAPENFLSERLRNEPPPGRGVFDDEIEPSGSRRRKDRK